MFYEIRLKHDHAFLISKSDIIVHNCPLFGIGILLTCGGGKIAIEAVWAGICLFGWWLGSQVCGVSKSPRLFIEPKVNGCNYPAQTQNQRDDSNTDFKLAVIPSDNQIFFREAKGDCLIVPSQHEPNKSCGSPACIPPRYGPNGCHISSPKHSSEQKGSIAAGLNMEEGQKALDVSVPVKDKYGIKKNQRVAVWKGRYVVFFPTDLEKNVWHNHIRSWEKDRYGNNGLDKDMQRALENAGITKGSKGKIIKDIKNK